MKKIIDYIKKNYILCMVVLAIILVVIGSLIILNIIKLNKTTIESRSENYTLYENYNNEKKEFKAKVTFENDKIVSIKPEKYNLSNKSVIYYASLKRIIIPRDMMIVFYRQNNASPKAPKYSEFAYDAGTSIIFVEGKKSLNSDFFLYDGDDFYFFVSPVVLTVNGESYSLSAFSYIESLSEDLIFYDYDTSVEQRINNVSSASVKIKNDMYVDILNDATVENGRQVILNNMVDNMPIYKED